MCKADDLPRAGLRRLLLLVWVLGAGCALKITPVPIEPHLAEVNRSDGHATLRLGVGVFDDIRHPDARTESHPPLRVDRIEIYRRGEVRTGDSSFIGSVAEGVRRDAVVTLLRTGLFSSVRSVETDTAAASIRKVPPGVDLVLTARIQAFGAVQEQDSSLNFMRVGLLRSRFENSVGFARIHYRLYDRSGLAGEYRIDAEHRGVEQEITRAALDAMAVANESLAIRLYADLEPELSDAGPTLLVRVLDACHLGPRQTLKLMLAVDEVFRREAGLRLRAEYERWRGPAEGADMHSTLTELRSSIPAGGAVVLAFVPRNDGLMPTLLDESFGLADPLGQHAVVSCGTDGTISATTLSHELAHLFGAVHVRDRSSVMHRAMEFDARFFDSLNRRILRATRERPWGEPLPENIRRRVRAIYTAAARFPECCEPESLEAARAALASP